MKNKTKTNKVVIPCPECSKTFIKQYISTHIKNQHKNSIYAKIIKRGMRYSLNNKENIFKTNKQIFCSICKRFLKTNSYYMHRKTNIHKLLLEIKNNDYNKGSNYSSSLIIKNNDIYENNDNIIDLNNKNKDNYDVLCPQDQLKPEISDKIFVDLNDNKQKQNNFYHNDKIKEAGNKNITPRATSDKFSYTSDYFDESSSIISLRKSNLDLKIKRMKDPEELFKAVDNIILRIKSKKLHKKELDKIK